MMQIPNPVTTTRSIFPWFFRKGTIDKRVMMHIEPISEAAFSNPNPSAPEFRMSVANTGIIATAPPKSTANMSRHKAPRISFVLKI